MKLSVIIPCYNEAATIEKVIDAVKKSPYGDKEIIVVDDCSNDGTREILKQLEEKDNKSTTTGEQEESLDGGVIKFLYHEVNQGKGAAIRTGVRQATGDLVVVQDADLEYNPKEFPVLVRPFLDGKADVVYGSRFVTGESRRVLYFWHSLGNGFLTFLSNMFTNLNLTDMETCYKVFKREMIQGIEIEEDKFGFEPEITAKIAKIKDIRIYEVGISYSGRTYKEGKKIGWKDGFRAVYCILKYNLFR
ncbi:MAG: glycosyltransferase family 2 protein [Deltaproteobacteria bacterium]|nr:glycosyltransferase family 2 protein [Deltaproteobacteria bacterium]